MEVKPLINYKAPRYPMKEQTLKDSALLLKIPERWKKMACIYTTISAITLSSLTSCNRTLGEVTVPTITLTEEEAIRIIIDEAKKQGLTLDQNKKEVIDINLPTSAEYNSNYELKLEMKASSLELDGFNLDKKIGFEFVSEEDTKQWIGAENNYYLYRGQINEAVNKEINNNNNGITARSFYSDDFYDRETAEQNLRKQIIEFITWLKGEGII